MNSMTKLLGQSVQMPETKHPFLLAFLKSNWSWLALWLVWINAAAFVLFGLDKWRAIHHQRRIPDKHLFLLAAEGGALGALLGIYVFHHKKQYAAFRFGLQAMSLAQMTLVFLLFVWLG